MKTWIGRATPDGFSDACLTAPAARLAVRCGAMGEEAGGPRLP